MAPTTGAPTVVPTFPTGSVGCLRQGKTVWVYNIPPLTGCIIGYIYPGYLNATDNPNPNNLTYTAFTFPTGTSTIFEFYKKQGNVNTLSCSTLISSFTCTVTARRDAIAEDVVDTSDLGSTLPLFDSPAPPQRLCDIARAPSVRPSPGAALATA